MTIKTVFVFLLGVVVGFFLLCMVRNYYARKRKGKKKVSLDTYAKIITTAVIAHGMILTTWSYVLAGSGMDPVVDVSSTIVREIVAPVVVYLTTNMIMNIFEKNKLSFSVPLNSTIVTSDGTKHTTSDSESAVG